ncbi:hypothetical protein EZI54_03255 [Marinobacter halodurans]|uniref:Uncharacterized protein n=1 Tax=Marinobacter halodurans TaxID=2528979 RepID=A0ABY1ZPX7_9GAMM|nr:hypothetical protein [Marinobacter halodurans]TBW58903.1 hypothetical protein EZI54_03255 [Marinobacter halodurans]
MQRKTGPTGAAGYVVLPSSDNLTRGWHATKSSVDNYCALGTNLGGIHQAPIFFFYPIRLFSAVEQRLVSYQQPYQSCLAETPEFYCWQQIWLARRGFPILFNHPIFFEPNTLSLATTSSDFNLPDPHNICI